MCKKSAFKINSFNKIEVTSLIYFFKQTKIEPMRKNLTLYMFCIHRTVIGMLLTEKEYASPDNTFVEIGTYILEYYAHQLTESTSIDEINALHNTINNE